MASAVARWPVRAERRKRFWVGESLATGLTEVYRSLELAEEALWVFVELQVFKLDAGGFFKIGVAVFD